MDVNNIPADAKPWTPITDPVLLKYFGKAIEEGGEYIGILGRIIIQGLDGCDPETGRSNIECLEDEIADVQACSRMLIDKLKLNVQRIDQRVDKKMDFLEPLHEAAGQVTSK